MSAVRKRLRKLSLMERIRYWCRTASMEGGVVATARQRGSHETSCGGKNLFNRSHHHTNNRTRQRPTSPSTAPAATAAIAVTSGLGYQLEAGVPPTRTTAPQSTTQSQPSTNLSRL